MTDPALQDPRYVPPTYSAADFERPSVTVDVVLFSPASAAAGWQVLLIQRKRWPYQDFWAIPGGFVEMDETLEAAALRELHEETGLTALPLEQLHTFGDPGRDPRTRVISVVYVGVLDAGQTPPVQGMDDAAAARWWPLTNLPPLAFDHDAVLTRAQRWLAARQSK